MYYSKSTKGFYSKEIHGNNIPNDCVEITLDEYKALINGQSNGQAISVNENGKPVLIEIETPELTYAELRKSEYPEITDYLDGIVKNDQEQIEKYIADCLAVKAKYPKTIQEAE